MTKNDIINAYCRIRTIDQTIPDEVLDFMKDSAIEKLEEIEKLAIIKKLKKGNTYKPQIPQV